MSNEQKKLKKQNWILSLSPDPDDSLAAWAAKAEAAKEQGESYSLSQTYNPRTGQWVDSDQPSAHLPSSLIYSAFKTCYKTNEAAQSAFDRYYADLRKEYRLALEVEAQELQASTCFFDSIEALHKAANQGEENPYNNAEAIRLFRESEQAIEQLSQALWLWGNERSPLGLENRPVAPSTTEKAKVPAVVRRDIATASNCQGDRDLLLALAQSGRTGAWLTNENEGAKYFEGKEMSVIYQPDELLPEAWWVQDREVTLEALNQRFASIRNDMTADIVDLMFHHWWTTKKPHASASGVEKTYITLRQICEYRGITPNKHNIEAAYQSMRDVRAFQLKGGAISEKLFDISTVEVQPSLWGQDTPPHADTAFVYSPGYFLSKAVAGERVYLAPFLAKIWELDPYRHAHAKRLARYLRGEWRMNTDDYLRKDGKAPTRWRTWTNVLEAAGINFEGYEATKKPARFIEGIHDAINTLCACGAIFEGKSAEKDGDWIYHPEDRAAFVNLPRQGAFARWLNLRVCIDPPAEMRDALQEPAAKRSAWRVAVTQAQAREAALPAGKKRPGRPRKKPAEA